jgi:CTP synthase (UTP-ammonia lyase)
MFWRHQLKRLWTVRQIGTFCSLHAAYFSFFEALSLAATFCYKCMKCIWKKRNDPKESEEEPAIVTELRDEIEVGEKK